MAVKRNYFFVKIIENAVLKLAIDKKKKGKLLASHRSTILPLLPSEPGGV